MSTESDEKKGPVVPAQTETAPPSPGGEHESLAEGEEEVPRGTQVMGFVRWALVALMAVAAAASILHVTGALASLRGEKEAKGPRYQCPMHPSIIQDQPGDCPICSMSLVPIQEDPSAVPANQDGEKQVSHEGHRHEPSDPFACPMHPEETGTSKDARCPLCGMKLEPKADAGVKAGAYWCPMHPHVTSDDPNAECPDCGGMKLLPCPDAGTAAKAEGKYWCPMHPHVTSDDPNAECPECGGMKLMPRPGAAKAAAAFAPDASVPGLVPIELKPERIQLIGMKTAEAKLSTMKDELRAVGFVTADEQRLSQVTTRFAGWIEQLAVNETGQRVKRGQLLATIYSPELLTAQQELLNARRWSQSGDARQTSTAVAGSLASDARTKLKLMGVAEHEIDQIEQTGQPFRALPIRSAVDGYVIAKNALAGGYVQPGIELFRIADLSRVWVLADVYEYELSRVRVGQKAEVSFAAYPGRKFEGKVGYIYPTVETSTRTIRVRLEVKNPKLELRPGMYGDVILTGGGTQQVVLVPRDAVVDTGELQYVFIAHGGGRFEPRRVVVGARSGDDVQLVQGVSAGEVVVTSGNFLLDSESSLRFRVSGPSFATGAPGGETKAPQSECDARIDREKFPDKYEQCLQCEQQHRGMGTMEEDCKNTIPKPWK